jgi:hypothetical protein
VTDQSPDSGPGQTDPGHSDPRQTGPRQTGPGQTGPGQSDPGQSDPGQSSPGHPADHVELTDPRALRAYAHPIRLALLTLLRRDGPRTATQAAAAIGESVASCSFHLRQLARYGLVEEVPTTGGRAKPWRATARYTSWRADGDDPELAAAAAALEHSVLDHYYRAAAAWLDRRASEPPAWRRAGQLSDDLVYVTADEANDLNARIAALLGEFAPRADAPDRRPPGSRPVHVITLVVPQAPSDSAGQP